MIREQLQKLGTAGLAVLAAACTVAGCGGGGGPAGAGAPPVSGTIVFRAVDPATATPNVRELFAAADDGSALVKLNQDLPAGTEVNLFAISPDKSSVAFTVTAAPDEHELYVVPIGGGAPVLVSEPIRHRIFEILWSPDSRSVAWQGDTVPGATDVRGLWVATPDASDRAWPVSTDLFAQIDPTNPASTELAEAIDPQWSPDSHFLGFLVKTTGSGRAVGLRVVDMQARQPDNSPVNNGALVTTPAIYPATGNIEESLQWQWAPDGSALAYVGDPITSGKRELFVSTADGTTTTKLHPTPAGPGVGSFDWSPDSGRLAYVSSQDGNTEIWVSNADGSVNEKQHKDLAGTQGAIAAKWSPDGQLAYISAQVLFNVNDLYLVTDKVQNRQLVRQRIQGNRVVDFDWLPGNQSLIYFANAELITTFELWTMSTGEFHDFVLDNPRAAPFSDPLTADDSIREYFLNPQRDRAAYMTFLAADNSVHMFARPIGSGPQLQVHDPLPTGAFIDWKDWSPDGTRLGYTVRDGTATTLYANATGGGAPVVLNGDKRVVSLDTCCRY